MKLHFISGLPRSGSTLLAAILRQNPRFRAGMSSPLAQIIMQVQRAMSRGQEGSIFISDEQRKRIFHNVINGYYGTQKPDSVVFDTNRAWCAKLPLIASLYSEAKVICCVRNVSWIMNSIEKLIRSNPLSLSGIFSYEPGGTVFSRVNGLASADGMVGYAMNALREAYGSEFADRLILLDYEALARKPADAIKHIYEFLGESLFEHDFEHVDYEAEDFDSALGTPGLHSVKGRVEWRERDMVLPVELFARFRDDSFWRDQSNNHRCVPVIMFQPLLREIASGNN